MLPELAADLALLLVDEGDEPKHVVLLVGDAHIVDRTADAEVVGDVILVEGAVRREDEVYLSRRRVHQLPIQCTSRSTYHQTE